MAQQLNKDAFGRAMEVLGMQLNRMADRADELRKMEWNQLENSWQEAIGSPKQLQAALMTKALGFFDMAMDQMDEELRSSKTALRWVFDQLPEINEEES